MTAFRVLRSLLWFCCLPLCRPALAFDPPNLSWTNNLLTVASPALPGGKLEIWYLEAFCRKGSAHRDWSKTIWPHRTTLLSSTPRKLSVRTEVGAQVQVSHEVAVLDDGLDLGFAFR